MSGLPGYDAWATGGRYSSSPLVITCKNCGETTPVVAETEYGATSWSPEECSVCGEVFSGDEDWIDDEPPDRYDGLDDD